MQVKIIEKPAMKIIGLKVTTTQKNNTIPQLWDKFNQRFKEIKNVVNPYACLGICPYVEMENFDENSKFDYIAGMIVKNFDHIPEEMITIEIPAQKYAVITHKGALSALMNTYQYLHGEWLQNSEYKTAKLPEIEWYDERFEFNSENSELDIYLPIE